MLKIYQTILSLYKEKFSKSSPEFKKGFETALTFLEIGIKKTTHYNYVIECERLSRLVRKMSNENYKLKVEKDHYKEELHKKGLVIIEPIEDFIPYSLETLYGDFTIVINADKETLMSLWFSFLMKTAYLSVDECKSKFIGFLQQVKSKNFIVYKDIKTAKRELNYDSRKDTKGLRS